MCPAPGRSVDHLHGQQRNGRTFRRRNCIRPTSSESLAGPRQSCRQGNQNRPVDGISACTFLRTGHDSGVPIILGTVACNLKDCAPFASLHQAALDESRQSAWDQAYQEGVASENAGAYPRALESYVKAAAVDPEFAELQYRMG